MKRCVALAIVALLAGCAGPVPIASVGDALKISDYGPQPTDPDALVAAYLHDRLSDPYAAQIEQVAGPARVYVKSSFMRPAVYGWGMCFRFNAKNMFGAYRGFQLHAFIWRDGKFQRSYGELRDYVLDAALVQDVCRVMGAPL